MIQNQDRNIGPAAYAHLKADELLITSIFYTIQGEGPYAGTPAIFVRLAGCNRGDKSEALGCAFCDTAFQFDRGRVMSFQAINSGMHSVFIDKMGHVGNLTRNMPFVVITGGEPMLQNNLAGLCGYLIERGFVIQIESNGDRMIPAWREWFPVSLKLVVSPKVTAGKYRPLKKEAWLAASALKFVIDADPASPYNDVPEWAFEFKRDVFLSPLAVYREGVKPGEVADGWDHALIDAARTKANYAHAAQLAMQYGFRLSIQQHLFAAIP